MYTNKRIEEIIQGIIDKDGKMYAQIKVTTIIEMKAFIGLMYYRGLYGQNNHRLDMLFSEHGAPVFSATMSRMRFQFILAHLCFDDYLSRDRRWPNDRFVAIRELFEQCNINFAKALVPEDYLSLDETLYPMRNQISFMQYNPDKPAKYGMLFKSINSGRYPYIHQSVVYAGKPEGEPDEYYISGTFNYITRLVDKLCAYQNLGGRNISMDRLYSSFQIADWLLQ